MVASMGNFGCVGNSGNPWEVDPLFMAGRVAMAPLEYKGVGSVLGHYAVAHRSGSIAATLGALAHSASVRWSDSTRYMVLLRIKVGITIITAVTAAVETVFRAIIARGFSVDFTTNSTATDMATIVNTNKMRANMGASLMTTNGPRILTTAAMSGQTLTADAAPFAMTTFENPSPTLGASAVTNQVGCGTPMQTLYECTSPYQHPIVLAANEGVVIQPVVAQCATGTWALQVAWEWVEVNLFMGL